MTLRIVLRSILIFALAAAIAFAVRLTPLGEVLERDWIDAHVRGQGIRGELVFLCAGALVTAVGLPRQAVAALGGYAFGVWTGTLLATLAAAIGCTLTFCVARFLARDLVTSRFAARVQRLDAFFGENTFTTTLLIRFLPVGSNLLTNLIAGVSRVSAPVFISGSAVGYLPQMLIFALVGSGIAVGTETQLAVSVVLFAASGMLGIWLYRRYRDSHHLFNAGVVDADDVGASEASEK